MVEAAVEVVDVAWTALERHRDHAHHDAATTMWQDCIKLERELIQERSENHRLKAGLDELRKALHEARKMDCADQPVVLAAPSSAREDDCPLDLYERLRKKVDSPAFVATLQDMHEVESDSASKIAPKDGESRMNLEESSSWEIIPDDLFETGGGEEINTLDDDGFILVSQDDIIESLAAFVAKLVVSNPTAKTMSPKQMQDVVLLSFARMEQKGKLRKLWSAAKFIYSSLTWTTTVATTAFGLYKNPFILKALFKALTLSSGVVIKALL